MSSLVGTVVPIGNLVVPGGAQGPPGASGTVCYSTTSAPFTIPAVGASVTVGVGNASWANVGDFVSIAGAGGGGISAVLQITAIAGNNLTLLNPQQSGNYPPASAATAGLLNILSGTTTDYVGGDNACHPNVQINGFISKSAAYTLTLADRNKYILCTGSGWTLTLPVAAVGLCYNLRNDQGLVLNGVITLQPQGASTIDGAASISLLAGQECTVVSDGTNWRTFGLKRDLVLGSINVVASLPILYLPLGYSSFELIMTRLFTSAANSNMQIRCSTDGSTFDAGNNYYGYYYYGSSASAMTMSSNGPIAMIYMTHWTETAYGRHICFHKMHPGDASTMFTTSGQSSLYNGQSGFTSGFTIGGFYNAYGRVQALQFLSASGTFTGLWTLKGVV